MRGERVETAAALFTRQVLAVDANLPAWLGYLVVWMDNVDHALAQCEGIFNAAGDAGARVWPDDDAVDDDFHIVLAAAIDGRCARQLMRFAIDSHSHVACAA